MVSLEKRDEMPAYQEEIAATLAEALPSTTAGGRSHYWGWFRKGHRTQAMYPRLCENGRFSPPMIKII